MKKVLIEARDIHFAYDEKEILNGINLAVYEGEKIAVMGSNGAGKSTFFLNLNGVLSPDRGEILMEGKRIGKKELKELRKRVGFVFQDADSQIIASNVRAEISFGPMNMGLKKDEVIKRVESAIEYMDLKGFEDRAPHYLSGGEKKRVSIADILAMETEILIFDEPMAALDPVNSENVEKILNRLHSDGKTIIIATHDVDFAYRFADRIIVFYDGNIIADGSPWEIFNKSEILKKANLKKPAVMTIWEALEKRGAVKGNCPKTPEDAAMAIIARNKYNERSVMK